MAKEKHTWLAKGCATRFGKPVYEHVEMTTQAVSKDKARANVLSRVKTLMHLEQSAKMEFEGTIERLD